MSKQTIVSLFCGLVLSLLLLFGDQVNDDVIKMPAVYKPYVIVLVSFGATSLVPAIKKWGEQN